MNTNRLKIQREVDSLLAGCSKYMPLAYYEEAERALLSAKAVIIYGDELAKEPLEAAVEAINKIPLKVFDGGWYWPRRAQERVYLVRERAKALRRALN
jgi:hypothetical protein